MASLKTKFVPSPENHEWFRFCESLLELYQTQKQFVVNDIHQVSHVHMQKWILGQETTGVETILRNMLLDSILSAEVRSIGSGCYVPWFLYNDVEINSVRCNSLSYLDYSLNLSKSDLSRSIFQSIYDTVGPLTKIIVKESNEFDPVIKYRNSFRFPLSLDAQFHRMIGNVEHIELSNPIVIMIEGAPETIGEINNLLEWNHNSKRPVLLIARNFPEEISATLATNWLRNSLNVLPIPYGNTLESINLAADMCSITKGELISAHFGDIIPASVLNEDKWGTADRIEWSTTGLSIYKQVDVSNHVNNLMQKLRNTEEEDLQKIYRDRILSLSNDAIEVWIHKEDIHTREEIDSMIKHYNGYVTSGMIDTPIGPMPACFAASAIETAQSLRREILNIGGFLVGVENEVVAS